MSVDLSTAQKDLLQQADCYGRKCFAPFADEWEERGVFPRETFKQAATDGWVGLLVAPEYGGRGLSFLETALVYQAFAKSCLPLAFGIATHSNMAYGIAAAAEQREIKDLVPSLVDGSALLTYGFTETGAGSDPWSAESFATPVDGGYLINGRKIWATLGSEASYIELTVKIGSAAARQMFTFIVDSNSPGITVGESYKKTGGNLLSTVELDFGNCFVPESRVLSREGYRNALWGIGIARIFVAAMAIGACEEAIGVTARFLAERRQFGRPLLANQALRWRLAELQTKTEAGKWLVYHAATLRDTGADAAIESAMAKAYCADLAVEITDRCAQLFGGRGFCRGNPVERMAREARMLRLVDGTSEIQLEVISRYIDELSGATADMRKQGG
jgi:alkylation response protein AidB-like acyl-CoA dehydrogenase